MTSPRESLHVEPISFATGLPARSFRHVPWRRAALLGVPAMLLFLAVGSWIYWISTPALREIPEINLDGADPEVVNAINAAREAVIHSPRSAKAWGHYAMVLHAHSIDNAADICYTTAGELDRRSPRWPYLQGFLHHDSAGGPERAIPLFERAASLSPPNSIARLRLADMLVEQGRLDEANQEYFTVLAADPEDPQALFGLGTIAAVREKYLDSLRFLQSVAESPLVKKRTCALLANVHDRMGDRAAAERDRLRLAELPDDEPRPDDAMNQLGQLQVGINIRLKRASLLLRQNRISEQIEALNEAVERYPNSDAAWADLALALFKNNDHVGAEQAIQRCISLAPRSSEYRFHLGMLLLSQNRFQEAEAAFRKSLELRSTFGPAYFGLGNCLEELADPAGAAKAYRETLRYLPDYQPAQQRLEELNENS